MRALNVFKVLGPIDAKNVRRDSLLRWMVWFPLLIALLIRWGVPYVAERLTMFDIRPYYPLLMAYFFVMMTPIMLGLVIGFLLLDERDDQTLIALQVTPLSLNDYLLYRMAAPMLISLTMTLISYPLANLIETDFLALFLVALLSAPLAPLFALALASFASNKVEGFALTKASGVFLMVPLVAYFVRSDWQLLAGVVPTYWPAKLSWSLQAAEPAAWLYFLIGAVYELALLWLLLRRFHKIMHR